MKAEVEMVKGASMIVRRSTKADVGEIFVMARLLWPDVKRAELAQKKFTCFVAENSKELVGFILLAVRRDYVEGSSTSPVGYIEGLYVAREGRKKGVGRQLVEAAEQWCIQKGLKELGSDVEFHNKISQKFHSSVGFTKGDVITPYIKKVRPKRAGLLTKLSK